MGSINLPFPFKGINKNYAASSQPPLTTPYSKNVRPQDVLEKRARGGQRPGVLKSYAEALGDSGTFGSGNFGGGLFGVGDKEAPVVAIIDVTTVKSN
jgi:hypothetical protein